MPRCMFNTGDYCEYLTDGLREDEPNQECNVPAHTEYCTHFREDNSPDPVIEILQQYLDETSEEQIKLVDENGKEIEE
jgi:hypothetical protein